MANFQGGICNSNDTTDEGRDLRQELDEGTHVIVFLSEGKEKGKREGQGEGLEICAHELYELVKCVLLTLIPRFDTIMTAISRNFRLDFNS